MGYGQAKLARLGWIMLACCGCQACSNCCDYLPPVAGGTYGPPGIRAGSKYLNPSPSSPSADPQMPSAPESASTEIPGSDHPTRLGPEETAEPIAAAAFDQPVGQMISKLPPVSYPPMPYPAVVLPEEYHR
jgi:hypothetical protein